jgi:hypothetical protein
MADDDGSIIDLPAREPASPLSFGVTNVLEAGTPRTSIRPGTGNLAIDLAAQRQQAAGPRSGK